MQQLKPVLTVVVMVLASFVHVSRGELQVVPINAVFGGLAAFVAWGRFRKAPIPSRGTTATAAHRS